MGASLSSLLRRLKDERTKQPHAVGCYLFSSHAGEKQSHKSTARGRMTI